MKIEEVKSLINHHQKEIAHLYDERSQLEENKNNMSEEEYTKELENINKHLEEEQINLEKNQELNRNYSSMVENLKRLNELDKVTPRDNIDIAEIQDEKNRHQAEVKRAASVLPDDLRAEARNIILRQNKEQATPAPIQPPTIKENSSGEEANRTKKEKLEDTIKKHQKEIINLENIMSQLEAARGILSEDEYKQERENIAKYIERETNKLEEDRKINMAYDNMISNIRALNNLNNVIPRDRQDEAQIQDEKEKREEEIKHARKILPEEFLEEIRNIIQGEKQLPAVIEKENSILPAPPPSKQKPKKEERKTLQQIMYELQKDLEIKAKSGKRYQAANIKIGKNFKNELKSGNILYNVVHFAPTLIKSAVASVKKAYSKFQLWRTEQTHTIEVLKNRIDNLSDADLAVIWNEYRGTQVMQDSFTSALNGLLNERIQRFANERVTAINNQIATGYHQIFGDYTRIQEINEQLNNPEIKKKEKKILEIEKESLLEGKAEEIGNLRRLYIKGNKYYSGGAHGFSEDMKASGTNLSKVGKRFTINHDYDDELQERKAKLETLEASAIAKGDDLAALKAFVEYEGLKSDETQLGRGLKGLGTLRSEGKMYYSPLVGQLDYRDDPFIRDVFTTVAAVGAAVSAANAIQTHVTEANRILDAERAKAAQVNATNQQTINQVHQTGQDIANHRETFEKGMQAQANSDAVSTLDVGERSASNQSVNAGGGWSSGSVYVEADNIAHATAKEAYIATQQQIQDVAAQYTQGLLSDGEVAQEMANIASQSNQTLNNVIQEALPHFQTYMQSHPQFELTEVGQAMDYLVQNPAAIPQMYQGMVDVTNMGENLTGLTMTQVEALQSLPNDMQTTLLGAVSSAALAYNCAKSTSKNRSSAKSEQEQEIINMVAEYQSSRQEQGELEAKHQRAA